jgi:hypothetical protein
MPRACAGSLLIRDHPDAVALADPVTLGIGGCGVDLVEVVLDAARGGDQLQPGGPVRGPEPVRVPVGQEDEAARRGAERVAAAADGQLAVQDVEALIPVAMDMERRPVPRRWSPRR